MGRVSVNTSGYKMWVGLVSVNTSGYKMRKKYVVRPVVCRRVRGEGNTFLAPF